jgi:hypothetical protein
MFYLVALFSVIKRRWGMEGIVIRSNDEMMAQKNRNTRWEISLGATLSQRYHMTDLHSDKGRRIKSIGLLILRLVSKCNRPFLHYKHKTINPVYGNNPRL